MTKKAIIIGASGLIGSKLLAILLTQPDYKEVLIVARKKTKSINTKLKQVVIDFDNLADHAEAITGDVVFCCLGSTQKDTPNLDEYRKIDHDYPLQLAEMALKNGVEQFHLISSIGASSRSSNFYLKMKGDTEDDIKKLGIKGTFIYQPSLLVGHRQKPRKGERFFIVLMKIISPFLLGGLKKYRPITAETVAKAMYKQSLRNKEGVFIYTSDKIKKRA